MEKQWCIVGFSPLYLTFVPDGQSLRPSVNHRLPSLGSHSDQRERTQDGKAMEGGRVALKLSLGGTLQADLESGKAAPEAFKEVFGKVGKWNVKTARKFLLSKTHYFFPPRNLSPKLDS